MRKKHKMMDLRSLWEKAGKAQRTAGPTPAPEPEPRAAPPAAAPPEPPPALLQRLRFVLRRGLGFRLHDAIEDALREGDFRELLKWVTDSNAVLQNAPDDPRMACRKMVAGLVNACARETTCHIRQELGDDNFVILACVFGDACGKEHLAVCLRYVDVKGRVMERFLGVVPVENLDASTVKAAIGSLLKDHSLSWSRVRGQGYDGLGSMRTHMKSLKKLIMDEYPSAHYAHCFVQELHPALVCALKEHDACHDFFEQLEFLVSVLKISCRKPQMLGVAKAQEALEGLDHEKTFRSWCDARCGFHYKTILQIIVLYPTFRSVLSMVGEDSTQGIEAVHAQKILVCFKSFEFVFMTEFLLKVLGITFTVSNCLLRRDEFVINGTSTWQWDP
ncbi:hypothetical protein BS78_06G047600 [Paspalum vaginatum]|nr:hypothetical protein BS78_06G047600 [Paspalum vaginatum]